tara:strand:+ start:981 stop:1283 length:303 start_codon:yes stop_codon:yes gene_type:complete
MWTFKTGDLVSKPHPKKDEDLRIGIVIKDDSTTFSIKWLWYNKKFFMEKEGDIFREMNNTLLLDTTMYGRVYNGEYLKLLNSSYLDGNHKKNRETTQKNS